TPYTVELKEGQLLGENRNYRLEKNLGAGGMGEVWLASEICGGQEIRKVVVKTLRADRRGNEGAQEKALKQFQLIQKLNHQNICPIYVIEKDPACGYLVVMGYADGGSYADWFAAQPKQNGGLPLKTVCDVLRPIADALDHAHRFGVIHRDVKPENMMFMLFNGIRVSWLIDFGIATNLRTATQATQGQFSSSGTASYMAPEQKTGQLQTAQTDEYSLAMVALEFLTGSLSPLSLFQLSPALQPILVKALAPEPSARYATCREFIDALASAGTKPIPPTSPAPKKVVTPRPVQPKPVTTMTTFPVSLKKGNTAGERKILTADGIDYAFRWCPPGEFMMGSEPRYETRRIKRTWGEWAAGKPDTERYVTNPNELPHKVKLTKGFWLLETQVTQAMWQSVMGSNPSHFKGERNPVEKVSWNDCQEFCKKLSEKLGQQVKLPTEAQWEYACRAGTTGDYAGTLDEMAWYDKNSGRTTHAVGQKKPNAWGLYDMHGNVWERCSDYYGYEYYRRSPTSDPENTTTSSHRVDRGGGWCNGAGYCRSANRDGDTPDFRYNFLGLRVLVVPSPEE
ncbi:MAG: SUMF1/EgtB/PvdO family nonheme iron enzyme, partial [Thermoguttaceae bacterium]|nr:SUMF1/EgtB/PvdO family nonheme iron enzyme [Thermoguttaceae bacterium]